MRVEIQTKPKIRILAMMEAQTLTGPARRLIEFCQYAHRPQPGCPEVEVVILTYHRSNAEPPAALESNWARNSPNEFVAAVRSAGIEVFCIPERFRFDPRVIGQITRLVTACQPDIIQTHNLKSHFLLRVSGLWRLYPWVAFHHGYTMPDLKMRLYNHLDRWSLRAPDQIVTMNRAFAQDLIRMGVQTDRVSVLHNSVDVEWGRADVATQARALREQLRIGQEDRVVVSVGRLSAEKAHRDVVTAIHRLRAECPAQQIKLLLVGDGPERGRLAAQSIALGVRENVIFVGQVSDVRPYYDLADVFVLPSLSEGSPNVLLEAMAMQLPVIATRVGGVPEIATHGENALLIEPQDVPAIADSMARLLKDEPFAQRLGFNARRVIIQRHSPESRVRSLVNLYSRLIPAPIKDLSL